nr:GPCR kinase [Tanacetum cinerariifolium]
MKNYLKNEKHEQVVAIIKSRTPNALCDLIMTLKDLLGTISRTIYYKVFNEGGYGKNITLGASLILQNVSVFSPKPSTHYLNITMRKLVKVFSKDGNGSGVGSSGMLDEEGIIQMLEEEEMAELELQVGRNVTDQEEHQLRLYEEALILALEEEVKEAKAEQE